ncbi:MAG: T9SS type A sorting domain-containing protein [Bacteroidales bacterium]
MKTNFVTTAVLIFATILTTHAQDIVLGDFEDGLGEWETWEAPLSTEVNPDDTGINTSDSVALLDQSNETWSGMSLWLGADYIQSNHVTVKVDVYSVDSTNNIKLQMDNPVDSEEEMIEMYKTIDADTWTSLEFDISAETYKNYQQIALQAGAQTLVYFDNITLVEGETVSGGDEVMIEDFETPSSTSWTTWEDGTYGFEENIYKSGINTSDSVAYIDQSTTGEWSGSLVNWDGSSYTVRSHHVKLIVDVYPVDSSATVKLHMDNSVSEATNVEQYVNDVPANTWTAVEFNTSDLEAYDYQQIGFQTDGGMVYFDNLRVVLAEGTPIDATVTQDLELRVTNETITLLNVETIETVSIVSISGTVCMQENTATINISSLKKGMYIIVLNNGEATAQFIK